MTSDHRKDETSVTAQKGNVWTICGLAASHDASQSVVCGGRSPQPERLVFQIARPEEQFGLGFIIAPEELFGWSKIAPEELFGPDGHDSLIVWQPD